MNRFSAASLFLMGNALVQPAVAQAQEIPGWTLQKEEGGVKTYGHSSGSGGLMIVEIPDAPGMTPDALIQGIAPSLDNGTTCVGLAKAPIAGVSGTTARQVHVQGVRQSCTLTAGKVGGKFLVVIGAEPAGSVAGSRQASTVPFGGKVQAVSTGRTPTAPPMQAPVSGGGARPAQSQGSSNLRAISDPQISRALPGWLEPTTTNTRTVRYYMSPDGRASIFTSPLSGPSFSDAPEVLEAVSQKWAQETSCKNLASQPSSRVFGGEGLQKTARSSTEDCSVTVGQRDGVVFVTMTKEDLGSRNDARGKSMRLFDGGAGGEGASLPVSGRGGQGGGQGGAPQQGRGSPTSLSAAVASIPRGNLPIGMASVQGKWDSYNATITFDNYVLFPGGIAINSECKTWNPRAKPGPGMGCAITRYQKVGPNKVIIAGKSSELDLFDGFRPGERVYYNYGNVSGGGAGLGGSSVSQISGSGVKMDRSGRITLGSWVSNSLNGSNYSGYTGNSSGISGQYYVDGYLLAIQDDRGNISFGLIAKKQEGSDHYLYINGELFWNQ